jgi:2-polyprenyl-6-methoxyphenol hydroxylase-like FAD-dependent oxidoreductase
MASPSIAIIGAGPSGLVFARLLETHGITDYVVFERDASATPGPGQQGGTLDVHPNSGQLALRRAGLFEEFSRMARWDASCLHIVNTAGETLFRMGSERDAPEIDRLRLRQLLLDSIPSEKIRWSHAVKTIERSPEAINDKPSSDNSKGNARDYVIHFANGTSATGFRLIIGADGAWSKVRSLVSL